MTCKDCIHYDACKGWRENLETYFERHGCKDFKDKSRFVELPFRADETVYLIENGKVRASTVDRVCYEQFSDFDEYSFIEGYGFSVTFKDVGRLIFRSSEEAEKKLQEMQDEQNQAVQ